ncbi:MAG: hypothetical protein QXP98_00705 [Thermoproteus sp.]
MAKAGFLTEEEVSRRLVGFKNLVVREYGRIDAGRATNGGD